MQPRLIYLADLTHTGQLVASNTFPMGIGLLAASIRQRTNYEVEIFKYPDDLNQALKLAAANRRMPDLVGFSNYSWSCNLGQEYARRIKQHYPDTVVIAGGPNYGLSEWEQLEYWERFPYLDFYVLKEGELAIVKLLQALDMFYFNVEELKRSMQVPSCHYMLDGELFRPELMDRIKNLDELPSPYLMGLMDKFFDGVLIPMTYTTRGCPFQCSFCQEGVEYYSKVAKRTTLEEDLDYIGQRVGTIQDLIITDANFGMFREDTIKPLWETREGLVDFATQNLERYLLDELGTNELFKGKAVAFFTLQRELHEALYDEMKLILPDLADYLDQAMRYSLHRKHDLLDTDQVEEEEFDYDFNALAALGFVADPREHRRSIRLIFSHDEEQKKSTQAYVKQYGTSTLGLGRILMRAHVKRLFRNVQGQVATTPMYRRALNLYGD